MMVMLFTVYKLNTLIFNRKNRSNSICPNNLVVVAFLSIEAKKYLIMLVEVLSFLLQSPIKMVKETLHLKITANKAKIASGVIVKNQIIKVFLHSKTIYLTLRNSLTV